MKATLMPLTQERKLPDESASTATDLAQDNSVPAELGKTYLSRWTRRAKRSKMTPSSPQASERTATGSPLVDDTFSFTQVASEPRYTLDAAGWPTAHPYLETLYEANKQSEVARERANECEDPDLPCNRWPSSDSYGFLPIPAEYLIDIPTAEGSQSSGEGKWSLEPESNRNPSIQTDPSMTLQHTDEALVERAQTIDLPLNSRKPSNEMPNCTNPFTLTEEEALPDHTDKAHWETSDFWSTGLMIAHAVDRHSEVNDPIWIKKGSSSRELLFSPIKTRDEKLYGQIADDTQIQMASMSHKQATSSEATEDETPREADCRDAVTIEDAVSGSVQELSVLNNEHSLQIIIGNEGDIKDAKSGSWYLTADEELARKAFRARLNSRMIVCSMITFIAAGGVGFDFIMMRTATLGGLFFISGAALCCATLYFGSHPRTGNVHTLALAMSGAMTCLSVLFGGMAVYTLQQIPFNDELKLQPTLTCHPPGDPQSVLDCGVARATQAMLILLFLFLGIDDASSSAVATSFMYPAMFLMLEWMLASLS